MMIEKSFFPSAILDAPAYQHWVSTKHFGRPRLVLFSMIWLLLELTFATAAWSEQLPAQYFRLLEAGIAQVGKQMRSEEHTSELQSHSDLVCRLLLEKKKKKKQKH